jgi:hypothetical protein
MGSPNIAQASRYDKIIKYCEQFQKLAEKLNKR